MKDQKEAKEIIRELMEKHYEDAIVAKKNGELIGWASSNFPQELAECLGLTIVYPENHAAAVAAKKSAPEYIAQAEADGYSNDICSYARINLGFAHLKTCAAQELPMPDYLLCCNNICSCMVKWYETLAKELKIPLFMLDIPYNTSYEVTPSRVEYIKKQFKLVISQLEVFTGKKFSEDRFKEVMEISSASGRAWRRAMDAMASTPSPMNGFEIFSYMGLVVCNKSRKETTAVLNQLADELESKIISGESSFKGEEKHRILSEGIACWPYLGHNLKTLGQYGINIVGAVYCKAFEKVYSNLDEMAVEYATVTNCVNLEKEVKMRTDIIKENNIEGMLVHYNRSCKMWDGFIYEMERRIAEETGIPIISFDGDQSDPRIFSKAQFETRVQSLSEIMDQRKEARKGNR